MSNLAIRQQLVEIARRDVGKVEVTRNRAPWIAKYWEATTLPNGHTDRQPYCAAAVAWWVREWLKLPEVLAAMKMNATGAAERWRCKSARAFDWLDWAQKRGLEVLSDRPTERLRVGDIMVFDISHIGIVKDDDANGVYTIEANTGNGSVRDGDGCFERVRTRAQARAFIRLIEP
jgi:hypothetical protein